jgi:hypothetical protein
MKSKGEGRLKIQGYIFTSCIDLFQYVLIMGDLELLDKPIG